MALLRLAIGGGSGEKVGRPWPAWRGKRNAAELRKGWLCSVHALRHTLRAHTSALISPVYARARTHSSKHSTRTRVRDGLNSSIGVALVRKERVWIGRAIRRDRRSANWLSPITFIHLKSTRLAPLSLPPPLASTRLFSTFLYSFPRAPRARHFHYRAAIQFHLPAAERASLQRAR